MSRLVTLKRKEKKGKSFLDFKRNSLTSEFPSTFSQYAKGMGDIYYWPQGEFHVVTDTRLAKDILRSDQFSADRSRFFISRMPNLDLSLITDFFEVVSKMMVMSDGHEHFKRRSCAQKGLEDPILDNFKTQVEKAVITLIDQTFSQDQIEFVSTIARRLPSIVLADLFCIPSKDRENFFEWSNTMTAFFGGAVAYENRDGIRVNKAALALKNYFSHLIQKRQQKAGNDYVSHLLQAAKSFQLTSEEVISQAIMMLVAGQVTTTDQLGNNMFLLANHQDVQEKIRQTPSLLPIAIEEFKRFDPAVTFLFRVAKEDTIIADQSILSGETVFISNHAVNRPRGIKNADTINLTNKSPTHFAYGYGAHHCLGARLGRMQMNILFDQILKRSSKIELDPSEEAIRDHYSLAFSGFKKIPLRVSK